MAREEEMEELGEEVVLIWGGGNRSSGGRPFRGAPETTDPAPGMSALAAPHLADEEGGDRRMTRVVLLEGDSATEYLASTSTPPPVCGRGGVPK